MEKKEFSSMPYLNNYYSCQGNYYLDPKLNDYVDRVISTNAKYYNSYLKNLKSEYRKENYLYILEYILNYINSIYRLTLFDCYTESNSGSLETLYNVKKRYNNVLKIYIETINENSYNETLNKNNSKISKKSKIKRPRRY